MPEKKTNGRPAFVTDRSGDSVERRIWDSHIEIRAEGDEDDDGFVHVTGHAAVFDRWSVDLGGFREIIDPGFFAEVLDDPGLDTKFLVNHWDLPLAAVRSGDLDLAEDETGLATDARLDPEDPDVDRVTRKMQPGKLDKMSFGFLVKPEGDEWSENKDLGIWERRLLPNGCAELFDVSIVTFPAYPDTTIAQRRLELRRRSSGVIVPVDQDPAVGADVDARRRDLDLARASRERGLVD